MAEYTNVYVAGLPDGIDDASFRQLFDGSGEIISCRCIPEKKIGFVKYASKEEAQTVVDAMNGFEFNGNPLQVRFGTLDAGPTKKVGGIGGGCWGASSNGSFGGAAPVASWQARGMESCDSAEEAERLWRGGAADCDTAEEAEQLWRGGAEDCNTAEEAEQLWRGGAEDCNTAEEAEQLWRGGAVSGAAALQDVGGQSSWSMSDVVQPMDAGQPSWSPPQVVEAEPSDNLYIKGLPVEFVDAMVQDIFGAYGTVVQCKLINYGTDCCALMRMGSMEMAAWMVENLNGNIPQGLTTPISVRFADTPITKARKMQGFGKAIEGKGGTDAGPYGQPQEGGQVQFGNMDPNLPPEIKEAVDTVIRNLGGGGKKLIAHFGDESNLYVKDLPGSADELYIYKLFSPFGGIESVVLKKGEDGSWAIAFVKFMNNEGAANAIMGLTNCLLPDGTMPKVSVKTSKN